MKKKSVIEKVSLLCGNNRKLGFVQLMSSKVTFPTYLVTQVMHTKLRVKDNLTYFRVNVA